MDPLITAFLFAWLFMRGTQAVRNEWAHTRDRYRTDLARTHRDWSPGRVNRAARWRARGYWWHELSRGLPTFRQSWAEHRLVAETERAEAAAAGETRLAQLRERLSAARDRMAAKRGPAHDPLTSGDDGDVPAKPSVPPDGEELTSLPVTPDGDGAVLPPTAPAVTPDEPWTTDPAPNGWERPSSWLKPGEAPCEGCGGTGHNDARDDACPACRGWGGTPPDPAAPVAAPGAVCTACGNLARPGDPVLDDPGGRIHRSHAAQQQEAYQDALNRIHASRNGRPDQVADPPPVTNHEGEPPMTTGTATVENADTPFEGLQAVLRQHAESARAAATHAQDELMAAACTYGFDRDPAVMSQLQQVADAAEASAAAAESAQRALAANHADGAEYHGTGQDAHASAFRPA